MATSRPPHPRTDTDKGASVSTVLVDVNHHGQRVDNFLIARLKGVPRSRIYRALRSGEVRVNGSRCKASQSLNEGDSIRIPPIRQVHDTVDRGAARGERKPLPVLFEDDHLVVVDKPSGMPVHGGTGSRYGLIDVMRERRSADGFIELAHRLDRETSGCLVMAKNRQALLGIQQLFQRGMKKYYLALVRGGWQGGTVDAPLLRQHTRTAAKMVVDEAGQSARTDFSVRMAYRHCTLMSVRLYTGRMHQVRVHAASRDHPVAGDRAYGDFGFNRRLGEIGLDRLFLHAERLRFDHPVTAKPVEIYAPLPVELESVLTSMASFDA